MKNSIFVTLILASFLLCMNAEETQHQVNLEDIERDNVLSERRVAQSSQHFHPAGIQYTLSHNSQGITGIGQQQQHQQQQQVEYTTGTQGEGDSHHHNHHHQYAHQPNHEDGQVQYITPNAVIHDHQYSPHSYISSAVAQNELQQTYIAHHHGRQTPFKPIIPKQQTTYIHHQQQQHPQSLPPQFVYIQPQPQQKNHGVEVEEHGHHQSAAQHVSGATASDAVGGVQYAEPQDTDTYTVVQGDEQQSKGAREEPETVYQQQHDHQSHSSAAGAGGYLQYVPFVARGPSPGGSYIMMAPLPAGHIQGNNNKAVSVEPSVVAYSHSTAPAIVPIAPALHSNAVQYKTTASFRGGVQYLNNEDAHDESPQTDAQDIQYASEKDTESRENPASDKSKQLLYAPRHPERHREAAPQPQDLTNLHLLDTHKVIPLQYPRFLPTPQPLVHHVQPFQSYHPSSTFTAYPSIATPTFDFFSGRKAKSLLDSYIPSWVIIQKQRSLQSPNNLIQGYTQPENTYNTIAYSAPTAETEGHDQQGQRFIYYTGAHFKRSPKSQKVKGAKKE